MLFRQDEALIATLCDVSILPGVWAPAHPSRVSHSLCLCASRTDRW